MQCGYAVVQVSLVANLMAEGNWYAWQGAWGSQQQRSLVYQKARLPGGMLVTSRAYTRSRSRNGTRVVIDFADTQGVVQESVCEVVIFVEMRPAWATAPAPSSSSVPTKFAVVQRYNTVVKEDQPELAQRQLMAKAGDFMEGFYAVLLERLRYSLSACIVRFGQVGWYLFSPVTTKSSQGVFGLPDITGYDG